MEPITKEEIQAIVDSGVTKNFIEKKLKMGQGSIGKFLTGKLNSLPDKYAAGIRKMKPTAKGSEMDEERNNPLINAARGRDECGINLDEVEPDPFNDKVLSKKFEGEEKARYVPNSKLEPTVEVTIKRPKINKDLLP